MMFSHGFSATCRGVAAAAGFLVAATCAPTWAAQIDIAGPTGSVSFGASVAVLPNGNIAVTDPDANGVAAKAGAVYLYTPNGALISSVTGSHAQDRIGSNGVRTLGNGNFLILSPEWGSNGNGDVGAVTWVNGATGLSGAVSADNSLIGATFDTFGDIAVTVLTNGNYVVVSPRWNNGAVTNAGAVTWANGTTGISGVISAGNSIVGEVEGDCVGGDCTFGPGDFVALSNGNYIVASPNWDNGSIADAGAITWGDGSAGASGKISAANSLIGTAANDRVGSRRITKLANGNAVAASPDWNNGAGAVSWISATGGPVGAVSIQNSLVGTTAGDKIGIYNSGADGVVALSNGNYVVASSGWTNGSAGTAFAGAVTWGNGTHGISGVVSSANSLIGTTEADQVGSRGVAALSNGNYVVASHRWSNLPMGAVGAGAVTWGNGTTGLTGEVSAANSLTGKINDAVGDGGVVALASGNYVVVSPGWGNGEWPMPLYGAVTWADGTQGITGLVSPINSLVGSVNGDQVGSQGVIALTNGNYVVASANWTGDSVSDAGAVTWGDGSVGATGLVSTGNSLTGWSSWSSRIVALSNGNYVITSPYWSSTTATGVGAVTWGNGRIGSTGTISASNSLIGSTSDDYVGSNGITVLGNGNYVVSTPNWSNGSAQQAGAVTFCNGVTGYSGPVSAGNSLVGTVANDHVGILMTRLNNDHYVVASYLWNNGATTAAGAMTLANDRFRPTGAIASYDSVRGTSPDGGRYMRQAYDGAHERLVVGRPADNIVSVFTMDQVFADTFD